MKLKRMDSYEISALIGYYRAVVNMPEKWEILCGLTGQDIFTIKVELARYFKVKAIAL